MSALIRPTRSTSTELAAPVGAHGRPFGGYNTGCGVQNLSAIAGTLNLTYYDSIGGSTTTSSTVARNGYMGIYQGTDISSDGAYTAVITTPTAGVTLGATVNEVAPPSGAAQQSTAHRHFHMQARPA